MPGPVREVPALPVVVPLAVLVLALLLTRLRRRGALTLPRAAVAVVLCGYGAGIVANTLLPIRLGAQGSGLPWWSSLHLTPLVGTEPVDMLANVVVFAPLGVLLPLVARVRSAPRALLGGFLVSLTMEALQFANSVTGHGGHVADVNDLLANTLGAVVGYGALRLARLLPVVDRLARAATWPPPREPAPAPR